VSAFGMFWNAPTDDVFGGELAARCTVRECRTRDVMPLIRRHYLGVRPAVTLATFALVYANEIVGAAVFAAPPRETPKRYEANVWELARLFVDDAMPKNTETWFVSRCLRFVAARDVELVVSYADPSAGHHGGIYRAGNWIADGKTDDERKTPRFDYIDKDGRTVHRAGHLNGREIAGRRARVSKYRFVYPLSRAMRRRFAAQTEARP